MRYSLQPFRRNAAGVDGARRSRRFTGHTSRRVRTHPEQPTLKRHECRAPWAIAGPLSSQRMLRFWLGGGFRWEASGIAGAASRR